MSPPIRHATRQYVGQAFTDVFAKGVCLFFAVLAGHAVEEHHSISGTQLALCIFSMAAAFGPRVFKFALTRYEIKHATTESRTETLTTNTAITERRDPIAAFEPTP